MTTMNRMATINVTINCTLPDNCLTADDIKAMSKEDRQALYERLNRILTRQECDMEWDEAYEIYNTLRYIEDEEYREKNMAEFKAYEARMNEPDFDWDYYSDWHKDMFGYRPHYRAIPVNEDAREQMFEAFHRARGL